MTCFFWVCFLSTIISARGFLYPYPKFKLSLGVRDVGDPGKPLLLTPYIESGDITEARREARVTLNGLSIESYSGYFTVNKTYGSNQFFWYFPSMSPNKELAPVVVWLQGGPGASSLYGLFEENGPITVVNGSFQLREYHWARNHHLIYIDNPVGAGFSFTEDEEGYCTDQTQVGEELYSSMTQFFKLFPELQPNKFFVTGESYAGKYVPALAYTIHKKNPTADNRINLQGIVIGDGWCDPIHHLVYSEYLYQIGLIDWNAKEKMAIVEAEVISYIERQEWIKASRFYYSKVLAEVADSMVYNYLYLQKQSRFNFDFALMLEKSSVRKVIHVGDRLFNPISHKVYAYLAQDIFQSVAPWISELLDHYSVTIFNGQLDVIVGYPLTLNFLRNLNFTGAEEYASTERHEWLVGGEVAGYVKRAGRLTELLVRDAGHMVPADQPQWAWDMITRVTHEKPFY